MKKNFRNYLKTAQSEKWAIGQFNFSTFEQLKAIFQAAQRLKSPVIIGTSEGESKYLGLEQAVALKNIFCWQFKVPAFLNLDHAKNLDYIKKAANIGYDAIHFDGSTLSFRENVKLTKKVVALAKKSNVLVEGEIDLILGVSEVHQKKLKVKKKELTDPKIALEFVKETGVDSLAVNIGTIHGVEAIGQNPSLYLQRLKEIENKVGDKVFLVLHGGSGTSKKDIKKAIKLGIVKININTDLRIAFMESLRDSLDIKTTIKPYKVFLPVIAGVQEVVEGKIKLFNSVNKICR